MKVDEEIKQDGGNFHTGDQMTEESAHGFDENESSNFDDRMTVEQLKAEQQKWE